MTNEVLEEYLRRVRDALGGLPESERDAILEEMRSHLEFGIDARLQREPYTSLESATLAETRAFGEPEEIASARSSPRTEAPGATAVRPRGGRRAKIVLALLIPALAIVGVAIALEAADEGTYLRSPYHQFFSFYNETGEINDTFELEGETSRATIDITSRLRDGECLRVRVVDPQGNVQIDEPSFCGQASHRLSVSPETDALHGTWRIQIEYTRVTGHLTVQVTARR